MTIQQVTKRNGNKEPIQHDKIKRRLQLACAGIPGVSATLLLAKAKIQLVEGIKTSKITDLLIDAAINFILNGQHQYQLVAGRLVIYDIRKQAYGSITPPNLYDHVKFMTDIKLYDKSILASYTKEELMEFNQYLVHERDLDMSLNAVQQLAGKYLIKHRVSKRIYESPQMAFMVQGLAVAIDKPKAERKAFIIRHYNQTSNYDVSMPTPIMAGLRTRLRQFSSCVKVHLGDSITEIAAAKSAILMYVSQRAGLGINIGQMRSIGSDIDEGRSIHTGLTPFIRSLQGDIGSCSQGGIRKGSATIFFPAWHYEMESLIVLKNNKGVEENRARHLDYAIQMNKLFYSRILHDQNITLFSPNDVPGLYQAFFNDQQKFEELYTQYELDENIRKKSISAVTFMTMFGLERGNTGRIYIMNADHCNTHSSFDESIAPVVQSNLCMEITLPTAPIQNTILEDGEIALCTLAGINLGTLESLSDLEERCDHLVDLLDTILDYQNYPVAAAKKATMYRRPLGIGIINLAYYLAKKGVKYSDGSANKLVHETMEAFQFYLLKASCRLAKERGACPGFHETKYAKGLLPIDHYYRGLDKVFKTDLLLDWEWLRNEILTYGLRNSTLSALMPAETSASVANATNGAEPIRDLMTIKSNGDGLMIQIVPEAKSLAGAYEPAYEMTSNKGYLTLIGIMQKFVDQAISANTYYVPERYKDNMIPLQEVVSDIVFAHSVGVKTLYYQNVKVNEKEGRNTEAVTILNDTEIIIQPSVDDDGCEGGCKL
ncbi:class 1a ribonucleoside-diphosphate reductase subunit alpha [Pseudomonas luteola]